MFALLEGAAQVKCRDRVEITNDENRNRVLKNRFCICSKMLLGEGENMRSIWGIECSHQIVICPAVSSED